MFVLQMPVAMSYMKGNVVKVQGSSVTVEVAGFTDVHNLRPSYTEVSHHDCSFILFMEISPGLHSGCDCYNQ